MTRSKIRINDVLNLEIYLINYMKYRPNIACKVFANVGKAYYEYHKY